MVSRTFPLALWWGGFGGRLGHRARTQLAPRRDQRLFDERFTHARRWLIDIATITAAGQRIAIEYDGAYWHAEKTRVDTAKSLDLLAAGWLVVRLREQPLRSLDITHPRYTELTVYSTAPDPDGVIDSVLTWAGEVID